MTGGADNPDTLQAPGQGSGDRGKLAKGNVPVGGSCCDTVERVSRNQIWIATFFCLVLPR